MTLEHDAVLQHHNYTDQSLSLLQHCFVQLVYVCCSVGIRFRRVYKIQRALKDFLLLANR